MRRLARQGVTFGAVALALIALSTVLVRPASARSWLNIDESVDNVKGWRVGYSQGFAGCIAYARFTDKTTVWFGYSLKQKYFIALTNPRWQSLNSGSKYNLKVKMRRYGNWNGSFLAFRRGDEMGLFIGKLKRNFMVQFAKAPGFRIFAAGRRLVGLSLHGSHDALLSVVRCFDERRGQAARDAAAEERRREEAANRNRTPPSNGVPRPRPSGVTSSAPQPPQGPRKSFGTGFLVSQKGHVVTNNHVVKGCTSLRVGYSGGLLEKATLLATDSRNDLALLLTDLRPEVVPALKSRVRVGDNVYVYGFPLAGLLSKTGNFTVGYITSAAGLGDNTSQFQISAPVQPGNSGGPLVDKHGNVIGVIVSKLNVLGLAQRIKDVPQNVNFAIKASIASTFLEANGIEPVTNLSREKLDPADIAAKSKKYTVRVVCN